MMKIRWRFGVIAGLILAGFSLFPQAKLMYNRGREWNGHFAYNDVDEAAYAAYLNALINGRPRRNDPYTGRDETPGAAKGESVFSLQFAAPYLIAIPARLLGVNADLAMLISGTLAAFATGLAIFWLAAMITGDSLFAMSVSLATICFGTLAAGEGAITEIFSSELAYPFLPGFRRYVPAIAFPIFFFFCGVIWKLLDRLGDGETDARPLLSSAVWPIGFGCLSFGFVVFSYFYLWTAAAAVLLCVCTLLIVARPSEWVGRLTDLAITAAGCLIILLPYSWMLSHRESSIDAFQLAANTHSPDLFRFPELVAAIAGLTVVIAGAKKLWLYIKEPVVIFVLSLAGSVFVMFNQQVVTGVSLQPIHYQVFVGNYVAALALVLAVWLLARSLKKVNPRFWYVAVLCLSGVSIAWGLLECELNSRVLDDTNFRLDAAMPVAVRLRAAAAVEPDLANATVLAYDLLLSDKLPGETRLNTLWSRHQAVFSSLSRDESERRFFKYLYYLKVDGLRLERLLRTDNVTITALFGWDRHTDRLSVNAHPLTDPEIKAMAAKYDRFRRGFSIADAADPKMAFVIAPEGDEVDLSNVRLWYDLDDGEEIGANVLYRARLRDPSADR